MGRLRVRSVREIAPDEIFLDSSNLPAHEASQFEGRVVPALSRRSVLGVGIAFMLVALTFCLRAYSLEVREGDSWADISRNNTLERSVLFTTRGLILDRTGKELAWNEAPLGASASAPFAMRAYTSLPGLSHVLGFIQYPKADQSGTWWRENYVGVSGVELAYDAQLRGRNGSSMLEKDAHGVLQQQNIVAPPEPGEDLKLSIDASVQSELYKDLSAFAGSLRYEGGAGVIMDVRTGELLAITSFPEYDDNAFTGGVNSAVRAASVDPRAPLLNRAISGLYAPGSIVKPIFAAAALNESIISPEKQIHSIGAITLPNPYDPAHPSVFRDWTAHGWIDMRTALAVSSDEYFYTVGGGFAAQQGLGIDKLDLYARRFGLGAQTGIALRGEAAGVIPTPVWKAQVFGPDDPWRIGDTYHTAIGQYGFQITPLQAVRYIAAIANGGKLLTPQLVRDLPAGRQGPTPQFSEVGIPDADLQIVREGMRLAVTSTRPDTTMKLFNGLLMRMAAKTGTAQVGSRNQWENSWTVGFWPVEDPHYAFAVVLEHAPANAPSGAAHAVLPFFEWLEANHPEYLN